MEPGRSVQRYAPVSFDSRPIFSSLVENDWDISQGRSVRQFADEQIRGQRNAYPLRQKKMQTANQKEARQWIEALMFHVLRWIPQANIRVTHYGFANAV